MLKTFYLKSFLRRQEPIQGSLEHHARSHGSRIKPAPWFSCEGRSEAEVRDDLKRGLFAHLERFLSRTDVYKVAKAKEECSGLIKRMCRLGYVTYITQYRLAYMQFLVRPPSRDLTGLPSWRGNNTKRGNTGDA